MEKSDLIELEKNYASFNSDERFVLDKKYRDYLIDQIQKDPLNIQAIIHLGVLSWEPFREYEKAIDYLKRAIEIDPQNVEARFWLATCYYHEYSEYEKAKEEALQALRIDFGRPDCLCLLALISWHSNKPLKEAIDYLEKAIQYAPDWPMLRHLLATLYLEIQDIKSAEFHVKKALELSKKVPRKFRNAIEDYYENTVTGRSWTNLEKEFKDLIEAIQSKNKN